MTLVDRADGRFVHIGSIAGRIGERGARPSTPPANTRWPGSTGHFATSCATPGMTSSVVEPGEIATAIWDKADTQLQGVEGQIDAAGLDDRYGFVIRRHAGLRDRGPHPPASTPDKVARRGRTRPDRATPEGALSGRPRRQVGRRAGPAARPCPRGGTAGQLMAPRAGGPKAPLRLYAFAAATVLRDRVVGLVVGSGVVGALPFQQARLAPELSEMAVVGIEEAELTGVRGRAWRRSRSGRS